MSREVTFNASNFDPVEFGHFISVLKTMGLHVSVDMSTTRKTAKVRAYDLPYSAYEIRQSGESKAGRPKKSIELPNDSVFTQEATCAEFLKYKETHTALECMKQLGISSRATYYRKLKAIEQSIRAYRSNVAYNKAHNNGLTVAEPLLIDIE